MEIKQWEDKNLSHYSYAVLSTCANQLVLIDPARNPQPYLDYAQEKAATIVGIIETHPHADFVSSHTELAARTGATIYTSKWVQADYAHQSFDDGDSIQFGKLQLKAINTPGHSPDGISILLKRDGVQQAVFTGDTLFIGDCGRPDLREGAGHLKATRETLAAQMYYSLREKLATLNDDVIVYPAHGAGTLCGKSLSKEASSTIGHEKETNWSLQPMTEAEFVKTLLTDQPFVPAYFPYDVEMNRAGAPPFCESIGRVRVGQPITKQAPTARLLSTIRVIDARPEAAFKKAHLPNAINIMQEGKFETWLGSLVQPGEPFYLAAATHEDLKKLLQRVAAIGYEEQLREAFVVEHGPLHMQPLHVATFKENPSAYTIVDVRNAGEVADKKIFAAALAIPLAELQQRLGEIPTNKPIVVHCAGGYRSAIASSLIDAALHGKANVYDLGEAIKQFMA